MDYFTVAKLQTSRCNRFAIIDVQHCKPVALYNTELCAQEQTTPIKTKMKINKEGYMIILIADLICLDIWLVFYRLLVSHETGDDPGKLLIAWLPKSSELNKHKFCNFAI